MNAQPTLVAAYLGGSYWASATFEFSGAGQRCWDRAHIAVPTVFAFTTLPLTVNLVDEAVSAT